MKEYKELVEVDRESLISTLHFLGDKVDPVYKRETDQVIKRLIKELESKKVSSYKEIEYED